MLLSGSVSLSLSLSVVGSADVDAVVPGVVPCVVVGPSCHRAFSIVVASSVRPTIIAAAAREPSKDHEREGRALGVGISTVRSEVRRVWRETHRSDRSYRLTARLCTFHIGHLRPVGSARAVPVRIVP